MSNDIVKRMDSMISDLLMVEAVEDKATRGSRSLIL